MVMGVSYDSNSNTIQDRDQYGNDIVSSGSNGNRVSVINGDDNYNNCSRIHESCTSTTTTDVKVAFNNPDAQDCCSGNNDVQKQSYNMGDDGDNDDKGVVTATSGTTLASDVSVISHHLQNTDQSSHESDHVPSQYPGPMPLPLSCTSPVLDCCASDDHSRHSKGRLLKYLYISYLLCRWGDRMWEFAVGLFMIEIWKHSLLLTSLYGLVETASVVTFGALLGEWVDRFARLKVIQVSLSLQNLSVIGATVAILILLVQHLDVSGSGFICLIIVVNILGGVSALASLATKISLERDWIVVMAAANPSNNLTKMNAVMRRIDLSCTLLAAVFVGFIMSAVSVVASACLMASWNILCVGIEYWLLLTVYKETPRLHERTPLHHLQTQIYDHMSPTRSQDVTNCTVEEEKRECITFKLFRDRVLKIHLVKIGAHLWQKFWTLPMFDGWRVYIRQNNMLAGISFSLLSLSVLSFGTLMTASLKAMGIPAYVLGLARGSAALIGICATLSYPFLHAKLHTLKAGLFSVLLQWSFLILCAISVWFKNLTVSTALLMTGAAAARAGLWMFDLSVTQLMQESVPEVERGVVAGVQNSVQSFFQLVAFAVGMIISKPQEFGKLVLMSFAAVTLTVILYVLQMYHTYMKQNSLVYPTVDNQKRKTVEC